MTLDATWIAVPMRASPHPLDRHSPEPDSTQTTSERCSSMRTHREPGVRRDAHERIRAYVRANGPVALHAVPGRHTPRLRAPMAHGPDAVPRARDRAGRHRDAGCDLEEQQAYVPAADDRDYVGAPELAGANDSKCRLTRALGGVDGVGPRGRVLGPAEPSQPAPTVRWPADAPVIREVMWARGRSCEE